MGGKVVDDQLYRMFYACRVFDLESSADQAELGNGELAFLCLFKHAGVQPSSQLCWTTLDIVEEVVFVQVNTPIRVILGRPKGSPWYHDSLLFRPLNDSKEGP